MPFVSLPSQALFEHGLWFIRHKHSDADITDALTRSETALACHAQEWQV